MITIIDYGVGNIHAFINIYKRYGIAVNVASHKKDLESVDKIILPGVGAFDYAMKRLNDSGMRDKLDELVLHEKKNILGVCVGMQLMADSSEEGKLEGLGWIQGVVRKIDTAKIPHRIKLPHLGWNSVEPSIDHNIFKNMSDKEDFYFLHSFCFHTVLPENCYGTTEYGEKFASVIGKGNILGIQCHPEKSHRMGETFLKNFADL